MSLNLRELSGWQDENSASAEEVAVHYRTTHTDAWSGWLSDEAQGKLSALLGQN